MNKIDVASEWYVTGLVADGDRAVRVTVPSPVLVLDARSWARAQVAYWRDEAQSALTDGDHETAAEYAETASELAAWLQQPSCSVRTLPLLAWRQTIQPHQVTCETLYEYVGMLGKYCHHHFGAQEVSFVLDLTIEAETPILYTSPQLRAQARHTGPSVLGMVVSAADLQARMNKYVHITEIRPGNSLLEQLWTSTSQ